MTNSVLEEDEDELRATLGVERATDNSRVEPSHLPSSRVSGERGAWRFTVVWYLGTLLPDTEARHPAQSSRRVLGRCDVPVLVRGSPWPRKGSTQGALQQLRGSE